MWDNRSIKSGLIIYTCYRWPHIKGNHFLISKQSSEIEQYFFLVVIAQDTWCLGADHYIVSSLRSVDSVSFSVADVCAWNCMSYFPVVDCSPIVVNKQLESYQADSSMFSSKYHYNFINENSN